MRDRIEAIYRAESRRVFATLVRPLGDFDLAEEALHEAFRAALEQWPKEGLPDNPRAWLVSAGRFKAIDNIRRQARFDALDDEHAEQLDEIEDDRLRLVFTCWRSRCARCAVSPRRKLRAPSSRRHRRSRRIGNSFASVPRNAHGCGTDVK